MTGRGGGGITSHYKAIGGFLRHSAQGSLALCLHLHRCPVYERACFAASLDALSVAQVGVANSDWENGHSDHPFRLLGA